MHNDKLCFMLNRTSSCVNAKGFDMGLKKNQSTIIDSKKLIIKRRVYSGWLRKTVNAQNLRKRIYDFTCRCGNVVSGLQFHQSIKRQYCSLGCRNRYISNNPFKISESKKRFFLMHPERHPSFGRKRLDMILRNKLNNPMKNPVYREKSSKSLRKLYAENPEKLLNARLRRNRITNLELILKNYLIEIGLKEDKDFVFNKYVRTRDGWKFPDFLVFNKYALEADGQYWHKEPDVKRDEALRDIGLKVIHFDENDIINNKGVVIECLRKELFQ